MRGFVESIKKTFAYHLEEKIGHELVNIHTTKVRT